MASGSSSEGLRRLLSNRVRNKSKLERSGERKDERELQPVAGAAGTVSKASRTEEKSQRNEIESVSEALKLLLPEKHQSTTTSANSRYSRVRRDKEHAKKQETQVKHSKDTAIDIPEPVSCSQPKEDGCNRISGKPKSLHPGPPEVKSISRNPHGDSQDTSTSPHLMRRVNYTGSDSKHSDEDEQTLEVLRQVVRKCTNPDPMRRLTADDVYDMLKGHL